MGEPRDRLDAATAELLLDVRTPAELAFSPNGSRVAFSLHATVADTGSFVPSDLSEYHDLEGAFGRRAVTERAKGILMERHRIDEQAAFEMLPDHARVTHRKLVDLADAVVTGHPMLPAGPDPQLQRTPDPGI
jgi:hypothetical protein